MNTVKLMAIACRIEKVAPHLADELEMMARTAQLELSLPQSQIESIYKGGGGEMPSGGSSIGGFYQQMDLGQSLQSDPTASQSAINMVIGGAGSANPEQISQEAQSRGIDPSVLQQYVQKASQLYAMGYSDPATLQQLMNQSGQTDFIGVSNSPAAGFADMGGVAGIRAHERAHAAGATGSRGEMQNRIMSEMKNIGGGVLNKEQMQNQSDSMIDWLMAGRNSAEEFGAQMPVLENYVLPKMKQKMNF